MIIKPLNLEGFKFEEFNENIQNYIIQNKISNIISNPYIKKYKKYISTIDNATSSNPLSIREFLLKYEKSSIINDIIKENKLYDKHGNPYPIVKKDNSYKLLITKTTYIDISIVSNLNYVVCITDESKELPETTVINTKAPNKTIAKEIALEKFRKINRDKNIQKYKFNISKIN